VIICCCDSGCSNLRPRPDRTIRPPSARRCVHRSGESRRRPWRPEEPAATTCTEIENLRASGAIPTTVHRGGAYADHRQSLEPTEAHRSPIASAPPRREAFHEGRQDPVCCHGTGHVLNHFDTEFGEPFELCEVSGAKSWCDRKGRKEAKGFKDLRRHQDSTVSQWRRHQGSCGLRDVHIGISSSPDIGAVLRGRPPAYSSTARQIRMAAAGPAGGSRSSRQADSAAVIGVRRCSYTL